MLVISNEAESWIGSIYQGGASVNIMTQSQLPATSSTMMEHDLIVINAEEPEEAIALCHKLRPVYGGALVLCTDETDDSYLLRAYEAGFNECIVRPITDALLSAKIAAWRRRIQSGYYMY